MVLKHRRQVQRDQSHQRQRQSSAIPIHPEPLVCDLKRAGVRSSDRGRVVAVIGDGHNTQWPTVPSAATANPIRQRGRGR